MSRTLRIDVWFDFVCPWCLIGKRQLARALALLRESDPDVTPELYWHGLQLLAYLPAEGVPFLDFYLRRLGSEAAVRARQAVVLEAAGEAGATVDFAAIHVMPNTALAHRLFAAAGAAGAACTPAQADELLERLFAAYFSRGANLGTLDVLLAEAAACGLPPASLASALEQGAAFLPGASTPPDPSGGVPCFAFDGGLYLSGAQPPARLHAMMRQALAVQPA
jgi:predicted DsbA family dithiol-disulfide isomerase